MKRTYKALLLSTFMIFGIYSCSLSTNTSDTKIKASKPENSKGLVGKAIFPASRKQESNFRIKNHGFKTKATATDIGSVSTISVITLTQNKTVATGLTDTLGNFQIDMSKVTLAVNDIYILEALKRTGEDVETIRTYIRWNGTTWDSITVGDVLINENTTAISIIAGFLNTPTLDLIGKIDPANLTDIFDSTNTTVLISKLDIVNVAKLVTSVLLGERDPIALIKYDALTPYKYYIDQVYNYNNIATQNGCTGCSFIGATLSTSGASLSGKDLSYTDLSGQDLSNQDLSGTILVGADLRGAKLPNDLSYLDLSEVKLTGADLKNGSVIKNLKGTNLSYADLTGIDLSGIAGTLSDLTKARLTGCTFKDANLEYADLTGVHLFDATFDNTKISNSDLTNADLTAVDLSTVFNKDLTNLKIIGTNLTGANLSNLDVTKIFNKDMTGTLVSGVIMQNAILSGINLSNKNFYQANLSGVNFYDPVAPTFNSKLSNANFRNADLSKANLTGLELSDLNFTNCDLSDANLTNVGIFGTNFTGANLRRANLKARANLTRAKFISADMRELTGFKSATDSDFSYADMSGQSFNGFSFIKSITGIGCKFKFTNMSSSTFNPNPSSSSFNNADFSGADMRGASFINASFTGAIFGDLAGNNANLSDANFSGANFNGAMRLYPNTTRSINTNFYFATWWNGVICGGSASHNGVCADSSGNVQP